MISPEILLKGYKAMCMTKHMDERMITLQRQGTITFALASRGEEACAVAAAAALSPEDWIFPQYREAGIAFWRELPLQQYVDQMFGNANDIIKGHQMPNFSGSRKLNLVISSAPLSTKIPHAAGCAYAMKIRKEKSIALCCFGDGATSEGDFHAGMTFASVLKVPAIFFCRNNGYAISTPTCKQFASEGIEPKAIGYGMKSYRIDGNDFFSIYETVQKARQECL